MSSTTSPVTTLTTDTEHPVGAVVGLMEQGATEKQAVAVALRDAGYTNQQVGDAFADLFGTPTKSGGAGNLVTAGLRAVGREGEIAQGTGTKRTTVRGPEQLISDELDRARAALESVTKPVTEAESALEILTKDPATVVEAHVGSLNERIAAMQAEVKALKADSTAFVASETTRLTERRDAAKNAADENTERMQTAIAGLEATLAIIKG